MRATRIVQKILSNYEGETPGVKANLCRILMEGKLGGTGKLIILPVDQGFEHGPARSFAPNPAGYDPHYHYQLAIDAGLSAYAAPLGPLEAGADTYAPDPHDPEGQQRQFADVGHGGKKSGDHRKCG